MEQGASGLDVGSGSAKQVRQDQQQLTRTSETSIRSTAAKTAFNYEVEGAGFTAQAGADSAAGKNAMTAGMIGAASSILGSASSVSSEWLKGSAAWLVEYNLMPEIPYTGVPDRTPELRPTPGLNVNPPEAAFGTNIAAAAQHLRGRWRRVRGRSCLIGAYAIQELNVQSDALDRLWQKPRME